MKFIGGVGLLAPIALTVPPRGYGGTERVVAALATELARLGERVVLFGRDGGAGWPEGVEVVPPPPGADEDGHARHARSVAVARRLALIHDHTKDAGVRASGDLPMLTTIHNDATPARVAAYGARPDHPYVALSQAHAARWPGLRRLAVVPNGLPAPGGPGSPLGDYWLFLGRMDAVKGADAAARLARELGLGLIMAGPVAPASAGFFEREVAPHLDGVRRRHVGEIAGRAKWALLAGARGLLWPLAWDEPFGLVAIEALAAGTPVVATARGALPEILTPAVGRLVPPGADARAWRQAVREAELLDRQACREHAARRFSARGMALGYMACYRALLAGTFPPSAIAIAAS